MAKERESKDDAHRQIIPIATDQEMFLWLEELFQLSPRDVEPGKPKTEPDSFPERIALRAVIGSRGIDRGPSIKTKEWKPMQQSLPNREQLVMLANEFVATAQREVNIQQRRQRYGLFAYSGLKGAEPYEQYSFVLTPNAKEYGEKGGAMMPATDDEDTHRDRFLQMMAADSRWQKEQFSEAISGVMKLQNEIIRQQADTIARQDAERRAWILASEEALSKKQEREIAADWAKFKQKSIEEGVLMLKGIMPAVQIYLSKGKVGIAEGLKSFIEGLSSEAELALFGKWEGGICQKSGILDQDQIKMLVGIAEGKIDPKHVTEVVSGFRAEQLQAASQVLRPDQIQTLGALAKAAHDVANGQNGAQA